MVLLRRRDNMYIVKWRAPLCPQPIFSDWWTWGKYKTKKEAETSLTNLSTYYKDMASCGIKYPLEYIIEEAKILKPNPLPNLGGKKV